MLINKVVVRFKNGDLMKGTTSAFFSNKPVFRLELGTGKMLDITIEDLKAIYFVKDFTGNKDRIDEYTNHVPGGGRKIQVEFADGEELIGYTQGYSPTRSGFFVVPADLETNNDRIYVITSATKKVTLS